MGAMPQDEYDGDNVITILSEQAKLNLKYRFADDSKDSKRSRKEKMTRLRSKVKVEAANHN